MLAKFFHQCWAYKWWYCEINSNPKESKTHEFHETCHSVTFIVLVNSHQRWKRTWNRVCFHLWCKLTLVLWCHSIVWHLFLFLSFGVEFTFERIRFRYLWHKLFYSMLLTSIWILMSTWKNKIICHPLIFWFQTCM